jgi:hypothetical protein
METLCGANSAKSWRLRSASPTSAKSICAHELYYSAQPAYWTRSGNVIVVFNCNADASVTGRYRRTLPRIVFGTRCIAALSSRKSEAQPSSFFSFSEFPVFSIFLRPFSTFSSIPLFFHPFSLYFRPLLFSVFSRAIFVANCAQVQ